MCQGCSIQEGVLCKAGGLLATEPPKCWLSFFSCVFQWQTVRQYSWVISFFVPKWGGHNSDTRNHSLVDRGPGECTWKYVWLKHKEESLSLQLWGCLLVTGVHCVPFLRATSLPAPCLTFLLFRGFVFNNSKGKRQHSPRCHLFLHPHPSLLKTLNAQQITFMSN